MSQFPASERHYENIRVEQSGLGRTIRAGIQPRAVPRYRMTLLGAFQLSAPSGHRIEITSKKAIALLALLATPSSGARWRSWIQEKLWGSLEPHRAQAGLRRELHRLRKLTADTGIPLLEADFRVVHLNLAFVDVDIRQEHGINEGVGEFLEGIDIAGEDAFEDWLREQRVRIC